MLREKFEALQRASSDLQVARVARSKCYDEMYSVSNDFEIMSLTVKLGMIEDVISLLVEKERQALLAALSE